jgi:hypothetical protein
MLKLNKRNFLACNLSASDASKSDGVWKMFTKAKKKKFRKQ